MVDQPTNNSAPGASPGGNTGGGFVRDRARQMSETTMRPAMPAQDPAQPEDNRAAPDQRQQQQTPPAEQKIKVGDAEYSSQELSDMIARDAEARVRRSELPAEYEATTSPDFKLPEGVGAFEFNQSDPALAAARKFALDNNLTQQQFSGLLDIYVASQVNGQMQQMRAREENLKQLGALASQRVDAISTWLKAIAGKDGAQVADFISKWPSAPIVRSLETVIRRFSTQGGADFSQAHRATPEDTSGKIPGFENMNMVQRRVAQMQQRMKSDPAYGRRGNRE